MGFPDGANGKEPAYQCRRQKRHEFDPCEDPPEEGMATHSSILPGESHGQRSLSGANSKLEIWGQKGGFWA